VRIAADGSDAVCVELPAAFFADLAAVVIAAHRRRGALGEDEETCWRVHALAAADEAEEGATQIEVTAAALPLPVAESALDDFVARSTPFGDASALDAPVFVASCVLDEALALAAEADALETGGVLVGRLHRDRGAPELFVEITAQIPARHATARQASFEFTPETWAAAHAAIELRAQNELILGWWHSHPNFCARCPAERWPTCTVARPFFSGEDAHLHRTCFPQAYQQALLVSDLPERRHTAAWFGWRAGEVAVRGFRVLAGEGRSR
jgi:proteasome lid subunit RPN8/RPN11